MLIVRTAKLYYTVSGIIILKQVSGFFFSEITKITKIHFGKKNTHLFQCDDPRDCIIQF